MAEPNLEILQYKVGEQGAAIIRISQALETIGVAIGKLAILEERHNETRLKIDRAFTELRDCKIQVNERITKDKKESDEQFEKIEVKSRKWSDHLITSIISAVVVAVIALAFPR